MAPGSPSPASSAHCCLLGRRQRSSCGGGPSRISYIYFLARDQGGNSGVDGANDKLHQGGSLSLAPSTPLLPPWSRAEVLPRRSFPRMFPHRGEPFCGAGSPAAAGHLPLACGPSLLPPAGGGMRSSPHGRCGLPRPCEWPMAPPHLWRCDPSRL